jgi:hypothetical protein
VPRRLPFWAIWVVLTAVTVGASWLGIRSVMFAGAPSRPTPLSAPELRRLAPTPSAVPQPVATTPSPSPSPSQSPSRQPASPSASPTPTWTAVPDGHGGTAYRRLFRVVGGVVTVQVSANQVEVVSSRPTKDYTMQVVKPDRNTLVVLFTSAAHYSRVKVTWRDGPQGEWTESVP